MIPTVRKLGQVGVPLKGCLNLAASPLPRCHEEKRVLYSSLCSHYDILPKYTLKTTEVSGHGLKSLKVSEIESFLLLS